MDTIVFRPIGLIVTPFQEPQGTPIQPGAAAGVAGHIQIFLEYQQGLQDLEGFSHIWLLYHFHLGKSFTPLVKPFLDDEVRGVFATRAPSRPNPIGLSLVRLVGIAGDTLHIEDVDVLNGTPLLDIKPFVPEFDYRAEARIGWLAKNLEKLNMARDDGRFSSKSPDGGS